MNRRSNMFRFIISSLCVGVICSILMPNTLTYAQSSSGYFDTSVNNADVDLLMSPQNPDPGTVVRLSLKSNIIDLNRYTISWFANEKPIKEGVGERTVDVINQNYGSTITIQVVINIYSVTLRKTLTLAPEDTTLLWEGVDAYVPLFYKGKKLPAKESVVRVVAIPNFSDQNKTFTSPKNGVYIWTRNDQVIPDASGYGRDSFLIKHNKLRKTETIEVKASSQDNTKQSTKDITLNFFEPKIVFYQKNPLTGREDASVRNVLATQDTSLILKAEPFFFSLTDRSQKNLLFKWKVNDQDLGISENKAKGELFIKSPEERGSSFFSLAIQNTNTVFQNAQSRIEILFQKR